MSIHNGYAIRRTVSCLEGENGTGGWGKYRVCCPGTLNLDHYGDNWQCDTSTGAIGLTCANSTWNLWHSHGYICCEPELIGFYTTFNQSAGSYGCDTEEFFDNHQASLKLQRATQRSVVSSSVSSGPNKGAIIGGVVGGICGALIIIGIIWFLFRRRRRTRASGKPEEPLENDNKPATFPESDIGLETSELEGGNKPRSELYDPSPMRNELPAENRSPQELRGDIPGNAKQDSPTELP